MKKLWAPWRLEYIIQAAKNKSSKKKKPCVFCEAQKGSPSFKNLVIYKGQKAYVIMNRYPYNNGHVMILPNRHISDFTKLTKAEHAEMGDLMARAMKALQKTYVPHGYNVGMNLGDAAGAGIKDHLHYHIVPRWTGDTNYMPVVGNVRVMVEHLRQSYKKLKKEF